MERTSRDAKIQRSHQQALALLNQMDDDITERGGDEAHLWRAQSAAAEVER